MKYRILSQTHSSFSENKLLRNELLYCGGDAIIERASMFIPKEPHETGEAYISRLNCATYHNYLAEIINDYVANIFSKQFVVTSSTSTATIVPPFYKEFNEDCDMKDNSLESLMRKSLTAAAVQGTAYVGVDFVSVDKVPETLLEEEISGTDRAYVFQIPNRSVIDWEYDDAGDFKFVVLRTETVTRTSLEGTRDTKVIRFKVWEQTNETVSWKMFEIRCKVDKEPRPEDMCVLVGEGKVSFKKIPVLAFTLPDELYIAGLIAQPIASLFKRQSTLLWSQNRSMMALLVYKQGSNPDDLSEKSNRGESSVKTARSRGAFVIAGDDEVKFVEPEGKSFDLISGQLKEEVDEIHRLTHTIATSISSTSTAMGRSGLSKMQDNKAKEIVLGAYAVLLKDFIECVYNVISSARNENIDWTVLGMDSYRIIDREQTLTEIAELRDFPIPSPTLYKHSLMRIASELEDDLPPETLLLIRKEIEDYVNARDIQSFFKTGADPSTLTQEKSLAAKGKNLPKKSK